MNQGIADRDKAIEMLDGAAFFTNKFGLYVAGVARPDDITLEEGSVAPRLSVQSITFSSTPLPSR